MKQFTFTENARGYNYPSAAFASHIFSLTSSAVTASGVTVTIPRPTIKVKYNTNNSGRNSIDDFINVKPTVNGVSGSNVGFEASSNALAYNTDITMSVNSYSSSVVWSFNTSSLFNANNKSVKTIAINWVITNTAVGVTTGKYNPPGTDVIGYRKDSSSVTISGEGSITLNAPPTFDLVDSSDNPTTQVWFDTPYVYTGLTTASIKVKNLLAQYGGDISSVAFTIGNQTVSSTSASAQTLSIPLNAGGTFTPTVKVTDSRGQVTTKNLNAITVNTYVAPSVLFSVERTDSSGVANDEGESAVVTAKFDWTEAITTIAEPTIVVKDPNNLTVSVTKAWYKDRALTTPITDWSEITEDMQVYCLLDNANHNAFNTQYSYQIAITPIDGLDGSGTTITQTLGGAFYTVDFLAGGHGIAFGQPSTEEGFFCNMDATFKEDLVAQDMTAQEVQDFVDNLEGGGGSGGTADRVIEQGTSGIWTYRKWESGIAECWGRQDIESTTYAANGGYKAIPAALPSGLFSEMPDVVNASGRITTAVHTTMGFTSPNDKNTIQTYLINRGSSSITQTGMVFWNVKGRWK